MFLFTVLPADTYVLTSQISVMNFLKISVHGMEMFAKMIVSFPVITLHYIMSYMYWILTVISLAQV